MFSREAYGLNTLVPEQDPIYGTGVDYYYSYSLLWDGSQESILTPINWHTQEIQEADTIVEMRVDFNTTNWNPRVTHMNIYRGI